MEDILPGTKVVGHAVGHDGHSCSGEGEKEHCVDLLEKLWRRKDFDRVACVRESQRRPVPPYLLQAGLKDQHEQVQRNILLLQHIIDTGMEFMQRILRALHAPVHMIACRRESEKMGRYNVVFTDTFLFHVGSAFAHLPSGECADNTPLGKDWGSHYAKVFSTPLEKVLPWEDAIHSPGSADDHCLWATWKENRPLSSTADVLPVKEDDEIIPDLDDPDIPASVWDTHLRDGKITQEELDQVAQHAIGTGRTGKRTADADDLTGDTMGTKKKAKKEHKPLHFSDSE